MKQNIFTTDFFEVFNILQCDMFHVGNIMKENIFSEIFIIKFVLLN